MPRPPDPTSLRQRALAAGVPPSTLRDRIKNGRKPRKPHGPYCEAVEAECEDSDVR